MRLEHLHTIPAGWTLEDDFARVRAWRSWGVDDLLDVSVPWSREHGVTVVDDVELRHGETFMVRTYDTPSGRLRHTVRRTTEAVGPGWVVQPDHVELFEDFNVPRALEHAVSRASDVAAVRHLYGPPDDSARAGFAARMSAVGAFASDEGVAVQAWSAFGMDAAVWLCGNEGAVLLALDEPSAFEGLLETITQTDLARTELAAAHPEVDLVVYRGWYSSLDLWSPALFDKLLAPRIRRVADAAHRHGKRLAYVMTTGVQRLAGRLADAGVDVLYFADPVQDRVDLGVLAREMAGGLCIVGGTNALSLAPENHGRLAGEIERAVDLLAPTGRFILHPVDALFPDTPAEGIRRLVEAWQRYRR